MKYDLRIKDYHDIRCFASRNNRECLGKFGYFAEDISEFENLDKCVMGICCFKDGEEFPFYRFDHLTRSPEHPKKAYPLFCPVSIIKEETEEKKYRPFTDTKEFFIKTNFEVGDLICIRSKPHNHEYHLLIIGWTDEGLMLGNFSEMTFDELLDKFELWDGEDNFIPFGVEENE